MSNVSEKLKESIAGGSAESVLLSEAHQEISELKQKCDALEEILLILARTPLPWDEEGNPTEGVPHFKERYLKAVHEASDLLGLELRSTLTRTEPRT